MNGGLAAVVAVVALQLPLYCGETDQPKDSPPVAGTSEVDASIIVTINPEGRVAVALGSVQPGPAPQGTPVDWRVKVINQGYSTGRLAAQLVGDPLPDAVLEFRPEPLKGSPQEIRTLRITLKGGAPVDLTIAFRLVDEAPDLGGRDRVHVLVRPLQP